MISAHTMLLRFFWVGIVFRWSPPIQCCFDFSAKAIAYPRLFIHSTLLEPNAAVLKSSVLAFVFVDAIKSMLLSTSYHRNALKLDRDLCILHTWWNFHYIQVKWRGFVRLVISWPISFYKLGEPFKSTWKLSSNNIHTYTYIWAS